MKISMRSGLIVALLTLALGVPAAGQDASSSPSDAAPAPEWPSGDGLRRELQDIGFAFRVDRESGDWLGWAPRASVIEAPALWLGGAGRLAATATFDFDLLQTDLLGADVDAALTALMEVAARLPLDDALTERARRFIVTDLLTEPPEMLQACYAEDGPAGAIVITSDTELGRARVRFTTAPDALLSGLDIDAGSCARIAPSVEGVALGDPTSERISIGISGGPPASFEPAETTLEGTLVTVVLTFRNDADTEQSLTFEPPLESDTGPVAPGDMKLIVVRQLEPGSYSFFSVADPDNTVGVLHIVEPGE